MNTSKWTPLTAGRWRWRDTLFATVAMCLAACAVQRPAVDPNAVARIRPGGTTQSDIRNWFGEPTGRSATSDATLWVYENESDGTGNSALLESVTSDLATMTGTRIPESARSLSSGTAGASPGRLAVEFDAKGVVTDYEFSQGGIGSRSSRSHR
jgi:hypothetical protein